VTTRISPFRRALAPLLVSLAIGAGCRGKQDAEPPHVPAIRFAGVDLEYALERVATEAGWILGLDEISPREGGADLALVRVDVDLPAGSLDDAMRAPQTAQDVLPGTDELADLGVKLGTRWWDRARVRERANVDGDGYTHDLAGQELHEGRGLQPPPVLREGSRARGAGEVTAGDAGERLDRRADESAGGTGAGTGARYAQTTELVTRFERPLGTSSVTTAADAALATAYLARGTEERFDALVTDEQGRPLAVVGAFKGKVNETMLHPGVIIAEAIRVPGAANIWFAHNHPSGVAELSTEDRRVWYRLENLFRDTAITPRGLLAVGASANGIHQFEAMEKTATAPLGELQAGQVAASTQAAVTVPVREREFVTHGALAQPITTSTVAGVVQQLAHGEFGLALLDGRMQPIAFVPVDQQHAARLRTGGRLDVLYTALSIGNPAFAVVNLPNADQPGARRAAENLANALFAAEVQPLDIVATHDDGTVTLGSQTKGLVISGQFFQPESLVGAHQFALTHSPMRVVGGLTRVSTRVPEGQFATPRGDVLTTRLDAIDEVEARDAKPRFAAVARESSLLTTEEKRRFRNDDDATLELSGASYVTTAQVGDATYVFVASKFDSGVSVFSARYFRMASVLRQ